MRSFFKKENLFKTIYISFIIALTLTSTVFAKWIQEGDKWKYTRGNDENNYYFGEWKTIDGVKYYFDFNGYMVTGLQEVDGEYFSFDNDGKLLKQLTEDEYMTSMANATADVGINPLGEEYNEYTGEYQSYMEEARLLAEEKADEEEYNKWLKEIENQEFSALSSRVAFHSGTMTEEEKAKVDEVIKKFKVKYITDDMTDFEKEMNIIQYIVANNRYDYKSYYNHEKGKTKYNDPCYSAYGALVKGTSVCSGYADAFQKMCEACGLESRVISGATKLDGSGSHAWNMVKLDGEWYLVDTTWEDPNATNSYGWGNLLNKWINRTVDDFPEHYTDPNAEYEIYDDGTTSKGKSVTKLDVPCTATTYGPDAVAAYLATHKK